MEKYNASGLALSQSYQLITAYAPVNSIGWVDQVVRE